MSDRLTLPVRRPFRVLAAVVALVCFALTGLSRVALGGDWAIICLFLGLMMSTIAAIGYWPRRRA